MRVDVKKMRVALCSPACQCGSPVKSGSPVLGGGTAGACHPRCLHQRDGQQGLHITLNQQRLLRQNPS